MVLITTGAGIAGMKKAELCPGPYRLLEIHMRLMWDRFQLAAAPAWAVGGIKAETHVALL